MRIMKKYMTALLAGALAVLLSGTAFAADKSPATGDISMYVVIALAVAAVAIIGTVIYTKKKK